MSIIDLDFNTCDAFDVIARSHTLHPSLLREALEQGIAEDERYAASRSFDTRTLAGIKNRAAQGRQALDFLAQDDLDAFRLAGIGPGIVALNVACKLQCVSPALRTSIAARTWE